MLDAVRDGEDRAATRHARCAHIFMSAIPIAATCCYWL